MACAVFGARPNSHPFQERKIDLKEPVKIGRAVAKSKSAGNNLIFDCKVLSRSHAVIWYENGKFYIQDTKSSNGTYVNNAQVGRAAEDSEAMEISSGDIVQFGVDVTENSKKVTHGCIVAIVTLIHPDGTEALPETDSQTSMILPLMEDKDLKAQELWQLSRYLQEALNREQMLEQKLATMQRLISNSSTASDETLQAFVKEDELLSRLDILENELDILTKETTEDSSKKLLLGLEEEKECYEKHAKETIRKLLEEKVDALQKLSDVQRSLSNSEDECSHMRGLNEKNENEIKELMGRHEMRTKDLETMQEKLDAYMKALQTNSEQIDKERRKMKTELEEAEKRGSTLAVQVESLQAECDFTKKQLAAIKEKLEKSQSVTAEKVEERLLGASELSEDQGNELSKQFKELTHLHNSLVHIKKYIESITTNLQNAEQTAGEFTPLEQKFNDDGDEACKSSDFTSDDRKSCFDYVTICNEELLHIEEDLKHLSSSIGDFNSPRQSTEVTDTQSEVQDLRKEIMQLNETIDSEQAACQKYQELAERFEITFAAEESRRQALKEVLDGMSTKLAELQEKYDSSDNKPTDNEMELKTKVQSLNNELSKLQNENSRLKQAHKGSEITEQSEQMNESFNEPDSGRISAEQQNETRSNEDQGTSQLLIALVTIFIAIGAAILLDIINVTFGNSPMLDPKLWKEVYENLF